ncbi:OmpA family protein [Lamprobacter modestohalophilus]|uniref:OmpA/MotB family protein n=1 Tax=Lamprobacter modestohalophilus TaxID=1064514 RepID=UPI002ADEE20B|nr:OmpA family protein [Lamprobacter modestohalophilus]MEA1050072.1 OmpA family protein [Lamprobacter modestohalophilus]
MPEIKTGGDSDAWLMSYLDVLTLLITLFVLLVSMLGTGSSDSAKSRNDGGQQQDQQVGVGTGLLPGGQGLQPQNAGLLPQNQAQQTPEQQEFKGLEGVDGVSIAEGQEGITLRIDDNLLFASGDAQLTEPGKEVIESLVPTLDAFDGQISVEGHTDDIPISTARFPSNWELSTSRAIAVLRHLIQSGILEGRLRAIGYADTQPLESNATAAGRAVNRRVELLLKQRL